MTTTPCTRPPTRLLCRQVQTHTVPHAAQVSLHNPPTRFAAVPHAYQCTMALQNMVQICSPRHKLPVLQTQFELTLEHCPRTCTALNIVNSQMLLRLYRGFSIWFREALSAYEAGAVAVMATGPCCISVMVGCCAFVVSCKYWVSIP